MLVGAADEVGSTPGALDVCGATGVLLVVTPGALVACPPLGWPFLCLCREGDPWWRWCVPLPFL